MPNRQVFKMFVIVMGFVSIIVPLQAEELHYEIRKFGIKAGEAKLNNLGLKQHDGQEVLHILFMATALNFYDEEDIFVDPKTHYPVYVERNLNIFGKKERITETYDQSTGQVVITKWVNDGEPETTTLERAGHIENIYGFIYRYRDQGNFKIGESFDIRLPTQDITVEFLKRKSIKVMGEEREAIYMRSDPGKFKIWFEDNPQKYPLRIVQGNALGKTSLVLIDVRDELVSLDSVE